MEFTLFYIRIFLNWIVQDEINKIIRTYREHAQAESQLRTGFYLSSESLFVRLEGCTERQQEQTD